ncbi:hypothetical protein GGS20DRAFT_587129 [Poronia punctata]|nr:hypothetical protein GGS20DRAFT_587129 [Poronia punctata]
MHSILRSYLDTLNKPSSLAATRTWQKAEKARVVLAIGVSFYAHQRDQMGPVEVEGRARGSPGPSRRPGRRSGAGSNPVPNKRPRVSQSSSDAPALSNSSSEDDTDSSGTDIRSSEFDTDEDHIPYHNRVGPRTPDRPLLPDGSVLGTPAALVRKEKQRKVSELRTGTRREVPCVNCLSAAMGGSALEACHILASSIQRNQRSQFWCALRMLWSEPNVSRLHQYVADPETERKNLLLLDGCLHKAWGNAMLAFKPMPTERPNQVNLEVHILRLPTPSQAWCIVRSDTRLPVRRGDSHSPTGPANLISDEEDNLALGPLERVFSGFFVQEAYKPGYY